MGATIQATLNDEDLKMLMELKDYYEDEQDREFGGKAYLRGKMGGIEKRREKINDTYVVHRALWELHNQIKNTLEQERREKQANASSTYLKPGFSKRNDGQQPERRWGRENQEANASNNHATYGFSKRNDGQQPIRRFGRKIQG